MNLKKSKLLKLILICLTLVSIFSTFSYADNTNLPQPSREFYVLDQENVLKESTKSHIVNINKELYEKTNAQIVVAVVSSLDDRPKEDFGLELFRKWGIGGKKENNGLLFLVAPNEREVTIQVGYGLEGAITDGTAGEILDNYVVPYFAEGDYDSGVLNGFNALINRVNNEYEIDIEGIEVQDAPQLQSQSNQGELNPFMLIIIVAILASDFIFFRGFFTLLILKMLFGGGRGGGGGFGGGGFGGGGSGGFGGGSSGGGGSAGGGGAGRSF